MNLKKSRTLITAFFLRNRIRKETGVMKQMVIFLVIFLTLAFTGMALAGDSSYPPAQANAYFDIATGHKYIKNPDTTYSEYSKRGKLLRAAIPNTTPLLVSGKYVHEVTREHYLVYEKNQYNDVSQKVLPASSRHPDGWQCKQLVSKVQKAEMDTAEAYEPAD